MTRLLRNTVYQVSDNFAELPEGLYRVLDVYGQKGCVVIFNLSELSQSSRPIKIALDVFETGILEKNILLAEYNMPKSKQLSDSELPASRKRKRDQKYELIRELVEDPEFLMRLVSSGKSTEIPEHAKKLALNGAVSIYRALTEYWRYGQTPNALTSNHQKCGGAGKQKCSSGVQRGRPKLQPIYDFKARLTHTVGKPLVS